MKKRNRKNTINFSATKAMRMYQQGKSIADIAVAMGYERGQGQNRTRAALKKAGVLVARKRGRKPAAAKETQAAASKPRIQNIEMRTLLERQKALEEMFAKQNLQMMEAVNKAVQRIGAAPVAEPVAVAEPQPTPQQPELTVPVPVDRETAKRECYLFVEARYNKLPEPERPNFAQELSGMLLAGIAGASGPKRIKPVALPEDMRPAQAAA